MLNVYLLIQNELETGPYTLEELLQLPLKPADLVWVIGQSEDWLHPLQVPSLQPYLVEDDGTLVVKKEVRAAIEAHRFIGHTSGVPSISLGSQRATPTFLDTKILKQAEDRHLLSDQQEKKLLLEQTDLNTLPAASRENAPFLEQGNTDLLREEVALPQAAKSESKTSGQHTEIKAEEEGFREKKIPVVAILAVLVLISGWLTYRNTHTASRQELPVAGFPSAPRQQKVENHNKEAIPAVQKAYTAPAEQEGITRSESSVGDESSLPVDQFIDSVQTVVADQDQATAEADAFMKRIIKKNSDRKKLSYRTASKPGRQPIASSKAPLRQQVSLQSRYLREGQKQKLKGVEVMVKNNSPELLQTVSVEVLYYKRGQKLVDKETVYFRNIHPHQSLTLSIPGNKKATSARFQLGEVTAARKH